MKKQGFFAAIGLSLWMLLPVCASAGVIQYEEKSTEEGYVRTIEVQETYPGKAKAPSTYWYENRLYELVEADTHYEYGRRQTEEQVEFTEIIALSEEDVTQISKEKRIGDILYVLDESSLELHSGGTVQRKGTRIKECRKEFTDLPDNDLAWIPLEMEEDGIHYMLMEVEFTVTGVNAAKIPAAYTADCIYHGLEEYAVDFESQWQTPARYVGHAVEIYIKNTEIIGQYKHVEPIEKEESDEALEDDVPSKESEINTTETGTAGIQMISPPIENTNEDNQNLFLVLVIAGISVAAAICFGIWIYLISRIESDQDDWEEE